MATYWSSEYVIEYTDALLQICSYCVTSCRYSKQLYLLFISLFVHYFENTDDKNIIQLYFLQYDVLEKNVFQFHAKHGLFLTEADQY
jgi:hypothetical protein